MEQIDLAPLIVRIITIHGGRIQVNMISSSNEPGVEQNNEPDKIYFGKIQSEAISSSTETELSPKRKRRCRGKIQVEEISSSSTAEIERLIARYNAMQQNESNTEIEQLERYNAIQNHENS